MPAAAASFAENRDKANRTEVARRVRAFYELHPFPDVDVQTPLDLVRRSHLSIYARLLDEQLPWDVRILDAGCGTGQLAIFLSLLNRQVVGIDFSYAALRQGQVFKKTHAVSGVSFAQMDLFQHGLVEESFDYVFCNGVLHHTHDAFEGFSVLCRLVRKGGYVILGLYNRYSRLPLRLRKAVFRLTRGRLLWLDPLLRKRPAESRKASSWYVDQYLHPWEGTFTVDDVLAWFSACGVDYVNAIPTISLEPLPSPGQLFTRVAPGTRIERLITQLGWLVTNSREGGFFVMIGQRRPAAHV